jgi:hypothetical protein
VRDFDKEGPRADGPPVVWAGPEVGPALVVIDPTGAAKHDDLPATWHQLARTHQVAWCRLPASHRSLEDVEDVLESLVERRPPSVALVAAGDTAQDAIALAEQFSDLVSQVLLVDPGPDIPRSDLTSVIARSGDEPPELDRVAPPLPLGHPDVVTGVVTALANADQASTGGS